MIRMTRKEFLQELRHGPYAWPGGYPRYFVCADGEALSFRAAEENKGAILESLESDWPDSWAVVGVDINWEDDSLTCAHTGERIESAYGD